MSIDCHAYPLERVFWSFIAGLMIFISWHEASLLVQLSLLLIFLCFFLWKRLYAQIFFLLLGSLWGHFFQEREPSNFKAMGGKLTAKVCDSQIINGHTKRQSIELQVSSFINHQKHHLKDFKVLFQKPRDRAFHFNDQIIAYGSLVPLRSQLSSEQAYINHLHSKGIYWKFIPSSPDEIQIESAPSLQKSCLILRDKLLSRLEKHLDHEGNYQVLTAMLFGLKQELNSTQKDTLRRSGLMHIFAVSGLHVGIVAFILLYTLRLFFIPVWWRLSLLPILLIPYLVMTGIPASAMRAWIMISIWSIGLCLKKNSISLNSLYCAGFIILLINPNQILLAGFQFSFLVIFALLMSIKNLDEFCRILDEKIYWGARFSFHKHHIKNKVIKAFGITLVAYLSSLGMNIYLSANSNPFSLAVNLLCIFLAAPLITSALICCLFPFLTPLLDTFTSFFAGLASLSAQFSLKLGSLSGINCALYSLAFLFILRLRIKMKRQIYALSLLILSLIILLQFKVRDEELIIFRSAGQEQVSIAIFDKGDSLLINCSDFQASSFFTKELDQRALKKIDLVICDNRKSSSLGALSLINKQRLHSISFLKARSRPTQFQQYLHQQSFELNCPLYYDPPLQSKVQKIDDSSFQWRQFLIHIDNNDLGRVNIRIHKGAQVIERSLVMSNYPQIERIPLQ
ncbi:ComEC/Rec2 family competence protein [Lentisphaera marina]|uniref:ComEC/Rec2 family competence protein n=1 Tax=Lentisphaera marina TaxID=1111041 RepID=UPI0023672FA6|nr:ComEC/Rec2 family competence protein [Lentisphaera marina]MDD7985491.1 ComEC/Rec2 family competence protein [Lentisphaera marina]